MYISRHNVDDYSKSYVIDLLGSLLRRIDLSRKRLFSPCKLSLEALVSSGIVVCIHETYTWNSLHSTYYANYPIS